MFFCPIFLIGILRLQIYEDIAAVSDNVPAK